MYTKAVRMKKTDFFVPSNLRNEKKNGWNAPNAVKQSENCNFNLIKNCSNYAKCSMPWVPLASYPSFSFALSAPVKNSKIYNMYLFVCRFVHWRFSICQSIWLCVCSQQYKRWKYMHKNGKIRTRRKKCMIRISVIKNSICVMCVSGQSSNTSAALAPSIRKDGNTLEFSFIVCID